MNFSDSSGYAAYRIGDPSQPEITFDEHFKYDKKAKATWGDRGSWLWWGTKGIGAGILRGDLSDATRAYKHYRSARGTDLWIDYEKAYWQDSVIKSYVDNEIKSAQSEAERLRKSSGKTSFNITGELTAIPNGKSENWQKTIGAHRIWCSAKITYDSSKKSYRMVITVNEIDRYNFNKGMKDIKTGIKDDENGRFAVLGWAKSFLTKGKLVRTVKWSEGKIDKATVAIGEVR